MNDESRPKAAHETPTKASTAILPEPVENVTDDLTDDYMAGYEAGWRDRTVVALDDADAAWWDVRTQAGRVARMLASSKPYADLCEQRGEPERAARQRQILADRGVTR